MFVKCIVQKLICLYEGCPVIGSILNIVVSLVCKLCNRKQCLGFCTFSLNLDPFVFFVLQNGNTKLYLYSKKMFKGSFPLGKHKSCMEHGGARHLVGPTCTLTNSIPIKVHMCKTTSLCLESFIHLNSDQHLIFIVL